MTKISKNAKLLISSNLIYTLTGIFINTFLVAYFLKITNENITTVSIYYITLHILRMFGNIVIAKIIKKTNAKNKHIMSLGIITRAIFILFIVILADKIATNYILIAIIYAISESLYWCAHELIYIDVTNNHNRKNYISIKKILGTIIHIISPIILGATIELYSFTKIATYILILSIIQIIITLFIKINIKQNNKEKYNFKKLIKHIKQNKITKITNYNLASIAYGIIESSISTLIIILTIMTFKTSLNLGILTTIFSICSMISLIIYNKFYNIKNAKFILTICSIIIIIGIIGILIDINKISLVIYNFCYTITFCIFDATYNTRKGNLVKECQIENQKEEYISLTTITIEIGRILGYILMLITSLFKNIIYFKILLLIVSIFAPIYCYLIIKSLKN